MERRTHAERAALVQHREECEATVFHQWLGRSHDYIAAFKILEQARKPRADQPAEMWWFEVHARIAFGLLTLPVLHQRLEEGRLYFNADQLRDLVAKIDALTEALGRGINHPPVGERLGARGGWPGLVEDLRAARDAVTAELNRSGRAPRREPAAVEREAIVRWTRLARVMSDPSGVDGVVMHLCALAGIGRHRSNVSAAVAAELQQERAQGHLRA
jgi:hypothetical protein